VKSQGIDIPSGADRDRTGDPLVAKPNEKVPEFYKLLNLRAVLGIGVEGEGPFGAPHCKKLTTELTTVERGLPSIVLLAPHPPKGDPKSEL
jgi:hypothetical protein